MMAMSLKEKIILWGQDTIRQEAHGLEQLAAFLNSKFSDAVDVILGASGRIVVLGIGKSGHIGRKIAATFASTGSPSLFVHPTEASHGDLGMIEKRDVVLIISKSGESTELSDTIGYCRRFHIPIIAITENEDSSLGRAAIHVLALPQIKEACPLNLAPTTSTTMALALGDALATACLQAREFRPAQFHELHPGGKLGQKLTRVRDVMHGREFLPLVQETTTLSDAILEMSKGRFGCVGVVDLEGKLTGIFTDGDLRRRLKEINLKKKISTLMHRSPQSIDPDLLIEDVAFLFTEKRIPSVFVCIDRLPVGIIHIHDLLQRGFV